MIIEHRNPVDRDRSIIWTKNIFSNPNNYIILDTESTGIKKKDVLLEIALIDLQGNELFSTLIRPTKKKSIPSDSTKIHGIRMSYLKDCPTFPELLNHLQSIVKNKRVLIYNAEFDERLIDQTCEEDNCNYLNINTECVMQQYSRFIGKWNDYYSDYVFQKLIGGNHSALGDCKATLEVIKNMAETELSGIPLEMVSLRKWWEFWK
tara:strand:+ start:2568 stop:3185 length:618 start_codon:yes stop_codon:yes gene_type:complete